MNRNGYIDVVKFFFAILIAEFHLNSGMFLGGRLAVEGFFMITGYLMVRTIENDRYPNDALGVSTVRYISHKYFSLFPILLPSVICASIVYALQWKYTLAEYVDRLPLLLFDIFPLRNAGFAGNYVVGISWYLSSMFIALSVLYPLCRKFRDTFILIVCPLLAFLNYGILSHFYGSLAVGSSFLNDSILNTGIMRAVAGCSLGCVIYEISKHIRCKRVTAVGRALFTVAEIAGFVFFIYAMNAHVKSAYDYLLAFLIFGLLIIGINGLSFTSYLWIPKYTKPLGIMSTLIVLNHYCYTDYFKDIFGADFAKTEKAWVYVLAVLLTCLIVHLLSIAIRFCIKQLAKIKLFTALPH